MNSNDSHAWKEEMTIIVSIVRVRRTRTCRTGYAHPRTWNLASPQAGAAVGNNQGLAGLQSREKHVKATFVG